MCKSTQVLSNADTESKTAVRRPVDKVIVRVKSRVKLMKTCSMERSCTSLFCSWEPWREGGYSRRVHAGGRWRETGRRTWTRVQGVAGGAGAARTRHPPPRPSIRPDPSPTLFYTSLTLISPRRRSGPRASVGAATPRPSAEHRTPFHGTVHKSPPARVGPVPVSWQLISRPLNMHTITDYE